MPAVGVGVFHWGDTMNIKGLLGRTFAWGKDGCWWLERKKGNLSVVTANALVGGAEVRITYWLDDEEECWATSLYAASAGDEYEKLVGQISPEEHSRLLGFMKVAEKILRQLGN
jgi:hypothetical protein